MIPALLCGLSIGFGYGYHLCGGHKYQLFAICYLLSVAGFAVIYADDVCAGISLAAGAILFAALRANEALAGTVVVAITFTFLTGVKLVITEGLPAWDRSDEESIRKKNLLTYAFLIAPAVAPIVYLWGVL